MNRRVELSFPKEKPFGILFIYLFICEKLRARDNTEKEGEADAPLSREPNAGFGPATLTS